MQYRRLVCGSAVGVCLVLAAIAAHAQEIHPPVGGLRFQTPSPNRMLEIASGWWPEIENTWVPIGWKDHPLRFNVLYNGTLIAQPVRYPARGQGVQLTFLPSHDGVPPRADHHAAVPASRARWRRRGPGLERRAPPPCSGRAGGRTGSPFARRYSPICRAAGR